MKPRKGAGPPGLELVYRITRRPRLSYQTYKTLALVLTFFAYFMFHATRKPPSIVKSVLKGDGAPGSGWRPFDGPGGSSLLGQVDLAFLAAYALGMFFAGHAADRADLRLFLSVGMLGSGLLTSMVGMAYFWEVHSMGYFLVVQVAAGLFQSMGWPAVVAVMANWFGKGKRGLVMGVWNAHTSLGNIAGTVTAAACLGRGWGWSFVLPGLAMSAVGVAVFALLVPQPQDVGLSSADGDGGNGGGGGGVGGGLLAPGKQGGGGIGGGIGGGGNGGSSGDLSLLRSLGSQTACVRMGLGGGLGGSGGALAATTSVVAGRGSSRARGASTRARGDGSGGGGAGGNGNGGGGGGGGSSDSAEDGGGANGALPVSGADDRHSSEDDEVGLLAGDGLGGSGGGAGEAAGAGGAGGGAGGGAAAGGGGGGNGDDHGGVSFSQAWAIPGVAAFAFALFFSKLIAYTFLYWLPYYIRATPIQGHMLSSRQAGDLSVLFDVGGVAGGVVAGHLSDKSASPALVSTAFTLAAVPALWLYRSLGHASFVVNVALMTTAGFLVNGPYALITTAVSADLGSHESLNGNARALATVTAIIDGMGSVGAAIGPMLTGYISESGGFDGVFAMLYLSATAAGALLSRMALRELAALRSHPSSRAGGGGVGVGGMRGASGGGGGGGGGVSPGGVQLVGLKV